MAQNKRISWLLNLLIVVTLIVVALAFTAHYKNWTKIENNSFRIFSGIYYQKIPFSEIDSLTMVPKIPSMERINGFSVKEIEKGVFKEDSIGETKVHVFVDKLSHSKIRMVYNDSLKMYFNLSDSTATKTLYDYLSSKIIVNKE